MVVAKANANSYTPYQLGIKTSGELRFMQRASSGNTLLDGPAKIPLRRWVHFAVVRDNTGKVQFYMDGQPTGPTQTVTSPSVDYGAPLRIGLHNAGNRPLNGALDNVRIYNVALTPLEIEADRAS